MRFVLTHLLLVTRAPAWPVIVARSAWQPSEPSVSLTSVIAPRFPVQVAGEGFLTALPSGKSTTESPFKANSLTPPPSLSLSFLFFLNPANTGRSQSIPVNPSQSQSIPVNPLNPINTVNPLDPVDPVSQFNPQSFFRQVPVPSSVAGSEQKYEDWASMLLWLKQRCELFQRCYIF